MFLIIFIMKRFLTVTALLLVAMTVVAQDVEYNITGEVRNSLDRMYLYSMGFYETIPIDSVDVTEGTFSFHGMAQKDELLAVGDSDRIMTPIYSGSCIKITHSTFITSVSTRFFVFRSGARYHHCTA